MADPASQDTNLAILAALQQLTTVVGALDEKLAHFAEPSSVPAAPAFVPFEMTQAHGYNPLVPMNEENELRRFKIAQALGILGTPPGDALLSGGARGFYRNLDLGDRMPYEVIPREIGVQLVVDADSEDSREAIDMASNLLPVLSDDPQAGVSIPVLDH